MCLSYFTEITCETMTNKTGLELKFNKSKVNYMFVKKISIQLDQYANCDLQWSFLSSFKPLVLQRFIYYLELHFMKPLGLILLDF